MIRLRHKDEFSSILWDDANDQHGNVEHIAEHDLTVDDVERLLASPTSEGASKSTNLPAVWGFVPDGRYIIVVYQEVDEDTIRVVTAYEVPQPKSKRRRRKK